MFNILLKESVSIGRINFRVMRNKHGGDVAVVDLFGMFLNVVSATLRCVSAGWK
jgi:hypothetical protein